MFTDPPLARVGLSEADARRQGLAVRVARLSMCSVLRAQTTGETQGFMKALVGDQDGRVLGFAMIGPEAGEVVATVQLAMIAAVPYSTLRDAVLAHPTRWPKGSAPSCRLCRPARCDARSGARRIQQRQAGCSTTWRQVATRRIAGGGSYLPSGLSLLLP
jgi:hypothetical protein